MFNLDDDIGLDSYRIHWLIWIQILIMFLLSLTILLSYLGLFTLDSSSKSDSVSLISSSQLGSSSNCSQTTQVEGHRDGEVNTASGNSNSAERDGSARKSLASALNDERVYHPCTYFDLAKQAFLKCLGLGSKSPNTPDKEAQTSFSKGNIHFAKLRQVEDFLANLISRMGSREQDRSVSGQEAECDDSVCCICYTSSGDSQFLPCLHRSCYGCITRHLLNCQRCFFCNATVVGVIKDEKRTSTVD